MADNRTEDKSDSDGRTVDRRTVLKGACTGVAAIGSLSIVQAKSSPVEEALDEFRSNVSEKYGKKEAKVATKIVGKNLRKYRKGNISEQEAYEKSTEEILQNPYTDQGSADIRRYRNKMSRLKRTKQDSEMLTTMSGETEAIICPGTCGGGGGDVTYHMQIEGGSYDHDGSYAEVSKADYSTSAGRQRSYVVTGLYGSGVATSKLWGQYMPANDGYFDITMDYNRNVEVNGAQLTMNIFVRYKDSSAGGTMRKTVETITTSRSGQKSFMEQFHLNGDYIYEIGLEAVAEGSSNSAEGNIADAYDMGVDRKVTINDMILTQV